MKKILIFVIIFGFLIGSAGAVLAQSDLNECCKVTNDINLGSGGEINGSQTAVFVGPSDSANCDSNGNGIIDDGETLKKASGIARPDWGMVCLLNTIYTITNWIFYILTLVAVLMIVYGGFIYISAAGDPAKAAKGKTVLTLSIIGLAIALLAKFVPSLVRFILGL
ncbi:MAG: pilin [Candidatus Pacebacteria bacterium]|nr:pilin [Candidatus Paceibacterota bacterium]